MASASTKTNGHKHKQSRAARARSQRAPKRKIQAVAAAPLNAQRDAKRTQVLQRKPQDTHLQQRPHNGGMHLSADLDLVGLVNRRTKAFLELPRRMARCHSSFEVWQEQARYVQEVFSDCQSVAQRMLASSVGAFATTRSAS